MFIVCQSRELDLNEFFKYENQPYPPSLSNNGDLYLTSKSDLKTLLESYTCIDIQHSMPQSDALLVDGSTFVYSLETQSSTFSEFAETTFAGKIGEFVENHRRIDVVFDVYLRNSLKFFTRKKRGQGRRFKVTDNGKFLQSLHTFLRNDNKKSELFRLLALYPKLKKVRL